MAFTWPPVSWNHVFKQCLCLPNIFVLSVCVCVCMAVCVVGCACVCPIAHAWMYVCITQKFSTKLCPIFTDSSLVNPPEMIRFLGYEVKGQDHLRLRRPCKTPACSLTSNIYTKVCQIFTDSSKGSLPVIITIVYIMLATLSNFQKFILEQIPTDRNSSGG